eukprot:g4550.t1
MAETQFNQQSPLVEEDLEHVEEYETVKLEACTPGTSNEEESNNTDSWTSYAISKTAKTRTPRSTATSEITPEDESGVISDEFRIRVSVSNPKKSEEISKLGIRTTFVSYEVQTETRLEEFAFSKRTVWRRFRDFDALHHLLRENHRGYVIPPLPSKNYIESKRGTETFIKERQMDLDRFLNQIAMHPVLYNTDEMKVFLGCTEDLSSSHDWYGLSEAAKKASSTGANGSSDLDKPGEVMIKEVTGFFKKVTSTLKGDGQNSHVISDTEKSLQEMVPSLKQFESQLTELVEKSINFGNLFEEIGEDSGLLGRICVTIGKFEEEFVESVDYLSPFAKELMFLGKILQKTGYACVQIQQICKKQTTVLRARLNPLAEELNLLPAVLLSLQDRSLALQSVYQIQRELETKRRALDTITVESSKKLGGMSGFSTKSAALSEEIKESVEEVERRNENYNTVTNRNLTELDRIRKNRHREFFDLALHVAKSQQEYFQTTAFVWTNLATEISTLMDSENKIHQT